MLSGSVAKPKNKCLVVITNQNDFIREGVKIICLCFYFSILAQVSPREDFKKPLSINGMSLAQAISRVLQNAVQLEKLRLSYVIWGIRYKS